MESNFNIDPGVNFENKRCRLVNRTGAAIVYGQVVALNLDFAATSGQAMVSLDPNNFATDSASGYIYGAAIAVTAENAARQMAVCLDPAGIADNAVGNFGVDGIFDCLVPDGTNAGEFVHGTASQAYLTPLTKTELDSVSAPTGLVGYALQANASGATTYKKCRFHGEAWQHMVGGGG